MSARVLIIEDEYALAAALATLVRKLGAEPVVAASGQGGIEKAGRHSFDAVLLDIGLPDMSGLKVLSAIRAAPSPPPVLIITAHGTLENALEARRLGAHEYFLKPLNLSEIQPCLRTLIQSPGVDKPPPSAPVVADNGIMVGAAPGMQRCFSVIAQACAASVPVLLHGPRGSGKTLAAQIVHRNSPRGNAPLVTFRYDEWPPFEAEKALMDALQQAANTTLLVEDIGTLPLPLQAVLARELAGPGGGQVRLLATTSQPLLELLQAGRFREDLYYQISVLQAALPPLVERTEDIAALASYLLSRAAPGRELTLAPETMACLKGYPWPGNVRELATATQHAAAVCTTTTVLPRHLPPVIAASVEASDSQSHLEASLNRSMVTWLDQKVTGGENALPDYDSLLAQVEKLMLAELLRRFDDKPTRLAAALQMNRATLRRKLRDLLGRD
ncbi:MAG TPA: response regulator [Prosthecobacter sp.]|nr:response regulator [Prosthecobacter sp.]